MLRFSCPLPVSATLFDRRTSLPACASPWTHFSIRALILSFCVTASFLSLVGGTGISTCCPSSTPFGLDLGPDLPWLRSRLTLGGRTFPRKPQTFDGEVSRLPLATYAGILSSMRSTAPFDTASARIHCSSTDNLSIIPKLRCQV